MTDKRKSDEVAELERWFSNAANNDEDWGGELSWLQIKWAHTATKLREYKLILREHERQGNTSAHDETILRGVIFCCAMAALGCGVAFIIYKFYL